MSYKEINATWIFCPRCGGKTRVKIRSDTVLEKFPLYCPKCKREFLVNVKDFKIKTIEEPDA